MRKLQVNREILIVLTSFLVQLPLAVFLGHYYDQTTFMDTGYLVSSGLNPYQPHLIGVFPNPLLNGNNLIIGYPPPWPLLLGLIYRLSFNIIPNLFLYNFAIKVPVIASNIGLAYIVKSVMQKLNAPPKKVKAAWLFLLFNPFILLTTSAWGQFDTLIALLCVASLYFLSKGRIEECALSLALSVALKPITLPLIGVPLLFTAVKTPRKNLRYTLVFVAALFALTVAPFYLMGWSIPLGQNELTAHFRMAGGMTPFNLVEIFQNTLTLPSGLELLGYMWLPALLLGYYVVYRRNRPNSMDELVQNAIPLFLIFFLTRTWLSEPNINLILPLMLIAVGLDKIDSRSLHLTWIIPLAFMFLNMAFPQLFFLVYPPILSAIAEFDFQFGGARLIARFAVTMIWYIFACIILFKMMRKK